MRAVEAALAQYEAPEIFNTDQGSQFTCHDFTAPLLARGIKLSMDGRGRCLDNVFVERLWRTLKYEEVYLHVYENVPSARTSIERYFRFYNQKRPHSTLDGYTPFEVYRKRSSVLCA